MRMSEDCYLLDASVLIEYLCKPLQGINGPAICIVHEHRQGHGGCR